MTNEDNIRDCELEYKRYTTRQMADKLCEIQECCYTCAASKYCTPGHNGMMEWLQSEVEE